MAAKDRPRALRIRTTGRVHRVVHRTATAAAVIGRLEPGVRVTGLTAGQFSAIDAMEHMVDELGPAAVRISTWTTGIYDVQRARDIRIAGRITDIRLLLDRQTFEKSPTFAGPLIEVLGVEAFRCLSVHAKVTIVTGERGAAVMRSSMNLNKNMRTEQFDVDVEAPGGPVTALYTEWFDGLWEESGRSQDNVAIIQAVYDRFLGAPPPEALVRRGGARAAAGRAGDMGLTAEDLAAFFGD